MHDYKTASGMPSEDKEVELLLRIGTQGAIFDLWPGREKELEGKEVGNHPTAGAFCSSSLFLHYVRWGSNE